MVQSTFPASSQTNELGIKVYNIASKSIAYRSVSSRKRIYLDFLKRSSTVIVYGAGKMNRYSLSQVHLDVDEFQSLYREFLEKEDKSLARKNIRGTLRVRLPRHSRVVDYINNEERYWTATLGKKE